jgi:hypothetical protein
VAAAGAAVGLIAAVAAGASCLGGWGVALGTTLRAIGRGFGSGTLEAAQASGEAKPIPAAKPIAKLIAKPVDRKAAHAKEVTAFPRPESFKRSRPSSI